VRSGYAEVRVERSGNWYLEARGQLAAPGMILTGFNVNGTTQVRLDQFRVWKSATSGVSSDTLVMIVCRFF